MSSRFVTLTINGEKKEIAIEPQWTLAEVLREQLHLTGTKIGCDTGDCGACTVLVDGKPILSCITLAITCDGSSIQTIEGVAENGNLHPLQKSFLEHGALQCGFCTSGMVLSAMSNKQSAVSNQQIREELSGNLCRCTGYKKIVEAVKDYSNQQLAVSAPQNDLRTTNHESQSEIKVDGVPKVTGSAQFTDDIFLPRMLFGKILRSPYAHAHILSIDTTKAEQLPGVIAIITGKELPIKYGVLPSSQDETALCIDKVRFIGDGVAAVAAIDEFTAQEALKLIDVRYEILPAILTVEDALKNTFPKIHNDSKYENNVAKNVELEFGKVEEGFAEADYIREDEFFYDSNTHAMLEPHSAVATYEPSATSNNFKDGNLTLWSSTQTPHYVHRTLAKVLEMPASHIRVIKLHLGGGFGGKSEPFALEFCAAFLSIKTGRPVKITYTREEVFYSHRGRHATKMWLKTGVKNDGTITAIQYKALLDGGAYGSYGIITTYYSGQLLTLPYKIPHYKFDSTRVYTNKPPCGPKRGHGAVQPRFAFEVQLDKIAEELGMDSAELRLKNFVEPNSTTINSLRVTSCGIKECIEKVLKASDWKNKKGKLPRGRGIGIATSAYISGAGKEINWLGLPHSGAIVKIDRGGGVTVFCGSSDIGQGSNTVLASLAAKTLGVNISDVKVYEADTDLTPVDLGSYSSRVTFMAGNAVLSAAKELRKKIFEVVAEKFETTSENLLAKNGNYFVANDPSKNISFIEAVRLAEQKFGTLSAVGSYTPPKLGGTYKGAGAGPSPSYSFTAHVVELEVDEETGQVKIHKVWSAHDCGKALNKTLVEGQIEGSVYMGIGEALYEKMSYTKNMKDTFGGLLKSSSLLDYKTPTSLDTPDIETFIVETNDPEGPLGAKEAGEGPLLAVIPAIANAIYDAVGIRMHNVPFLPENILKAMEEKKRSFKTEKVFAEAL
ncbi:MAG: molybdopterin-dependent oxidoreductase [Ignavibacteriales bacterium]|nr:molybdopterin-dependent oxidoreductase [Ignavibacteriales bacterium]